MDCIYYRPRNGCLQKLFVSEDRNKTVFRIPQRQDSDDELETVEETVTKNFSGTVIKLYDQCMEVLSNYTHCFESLVDFPEDFGKEIFEKALIKLGVDSENTKKSLQIFCDAYPNSFLPECKLSNMLMINNYELCLPMILMSTVKLDLAGCQLDDEHDLLGQLVYLAKLEVLSLAENLLTDKGLKRILLPAIGGKHLSRLNFIDLSRNKLDKKSLARLSLVTSLTTVVFGESDFKQHEVEAALKKCFRLRKCPQFQKIKTCGFGSQLLDVWSDMSKVKEKPKPKSEGFYSKPRLVSSFDTTSNPDICKNKVVFERTVFREVSNMIPANQNGVKRKADDEIESSRVKKVNTTNCDKTDFEQNLLSLYV